MSEITINEIREVCSSIIQGPDHNKNLTNGSWFKGAPSGIFDNENEVVLALMKDGSVKKIRALPAMYYYDFKDEDETYYPKDLIQAWAQMTSSRFIPHLHSLYLEHVPFLISEIERRDTELKILRSGGAR